MLIRAPGLIRAAADFEPNAVLALDFTRQKYRNGAGNGYTRSFTDVPGLTVSRSSVGYAERQDGTLVQFPANTARITDKGLLVEEARTNLLLNSQTIGFGAWSNNSATVATDAIVAPDGTLTADKVVENTATSAHFEAQNLTLAASTTYTISVYAKAGERTRFAIGGAGGAWGSFSQATFDLATGAAVGVSGGFTSQSIMPLANGWYRCVVVATSAAAPTNAQVVQLALVNAGTATSYTGDGVSGAYFWGAQLEAGAFATSYIPTTSASATRAADGISVGGLSVALPVTGYGDGVPQVTSANVFPRLFELVDAGSRGLVVGMDDSTKRGTVGGSGLTSTTFGNGISQGDALKVAANLSAAGASRGAANGSAAGAVTGTSTVTPAVTTVYLGNGAALTRALNGYLRRVVLYPRAFSDSELTAATQ